MEYRKPSENDEHGFCKHCGRDNRGYEGEACSDDCPFYDSEQGWSGTPHPDAPDNYWQDDETGEAVCAYCAHRAATITEVVHLRGCGVAR